MEELQLLVEMVSGLPDMALWVIIGYFIYKVIVVGSIYGVIRFCVSKAHSARIAMIEAEREAVREKIEREKDDE